MVISEIENNDRLEEYDSGEMLTGNTRGDGLNQSNPVTVKFIAKMFMDSKVGLLDDLNYDLPANSITSLKASSAAYLDSKPDYSTNENEQTAKLKPVKSRSTKVNADRVRNYLDYFYLIIEKNIKITLDDQAHDGVEGVYNPLQIIRNRKIRVKYDELPPRALFISKIPIIAIKQFSSKPKKKFQWYVDMSERSSDMVWRSAHWNELVNSNGEIWFSSKNINGSHHHHHPHLHHHHHHSQHDNDGDGHIQHNDSHLMPVSISPISAEVYSSPPKIKEQTTKTSSSSTNSKDSTQYNEEFYTLKYGDTTLSIEKKRSGTPSSDIPRTNKFEKILGKSKRWSKSPSFRSRSHTSLEHVKDQPIKKFQGNNSFNGLITDYHGNISYATPVEDVTLEERSSLLKNIPIRNVKNKINAFVPIQNEYDSDENAIEVDNHMDKKMDGTIYEEEVSEEEKRHDSLPLNTALQQYWKDIKYINVTTSVMKHRMITQRRFKKQQLQHRNKIIIDGKEVDDIIKNTTEVLDIYNKKLDSALSKGSEWNSKWLNDYSIRVESLISSTDRIMSDINTTLTLKLKLFQESSEKYLNSRSVRSRTLSKLGYKVLEYIVVVVLWNIWFVVAIFRGIKNLMLFILNIIKVLLW